MKRLLPGMLLIAAGVVRAAAPATEWAEEEFEKYTKAIFGATPEVAFVLPGETDDFSEDFAALKDTDGYAVRTRGEKIFFIADCPKGHVNGVHRWLEKNSDVIWPRPMNDLCFFTPRKRFAAVSCSYRDIPAFKLRFFGGGAPDDETRRYLARNAVSPTASVAGGNGAGLRYGTVGGYCDVWGGGHDMESRWFPRREFFAAHPEYYMLVDGQRCDTGRTNFCESNPQLAEAYAKSVEAKIGNLPPSVKIISINMEDTHVTCQCENCLKPLKLDDGTTVSPDDPAFRSTRFFLFFNKVARHVAKIRPDLKILQFAYLHLAVPPKVKVERNVILKLCPYPRSMRESVIDDAKWRPRLDAWLANTPMMYWREYYFCGCVYYPRPIADTAVKDLRYIRSKGIEYVYTDSPGRFGDTARLNRMYQLNRPNSEFYDMNAIEAWTVQKLFWDPSLDPETLRAEFIRRTFGPAAPDVAEFYRLLRESWYSDKLPSGFKDHPIRSTADYIVRRGISDTCRAALAAAATKADSKERARLVARMLGTLNAWISEAGLFTADELAVPFVKSRELPAADSPVWRRALHLPRLKGLLAKKLADIRDTQAWIGADGMALVIAVDVDKGGHPIVTRQNLPDGAYPAGDKVELMFTTAGGGYLHLAFDASGHRYTGPGKDPNRRDWQSQVERTAKGWRAVVRVPYKLLDFAPQIDPSLRFNLMVSYNDAGTLRARNRNFSLGGGIPHSPASWTPVRIEIEANARRADLTPWVSAAEREFVRRRTERIDTQPGTPESDAIRFYSSTSRNEFVSFNYDESKAGVLGVDYTLEDPLAFFDGRKVESADDWRVRRKEILSFYERNVYGRFPPRPDAMVFERVSEKPAAGGLSIERRYRQWFRADKSGPVIDWLLVLPQAAKKPCPVILHLNYQGNDKVAAGRTNHFELPLGEIGARGYAFMSACYKQITSDGDGQDGRVYDGVCELFGPRDFARKDNPGSLIVWAWGLSRGLDLAEKIAELDARRNVVIGSSRLGKAALLAAAYDERFAVCVPNQTGAVGVQLMKRDYGETLKGQRLALPHWYCANVWQYADNPKEQPFDQHLLLSCVAPRALLLECYHKKWFDPKGEWLAAQAAAPVWKFLTGRILSDVQPTASDEKSNCPPFGYVRRTGTHGLSSDDWKWALDFADKVHLDAGFRAPDLTEGLFVR